MPLSALQPSQLYISSEKLEAVRRRYRPDNMTSLPPVPIKKLGRSLVITDGHTRAAAAALAGLTEVLVYWEDEELGWDLYRVCIRWCRRAGIRTIYELKDRIISPEQYQRLWLKRCARMQTAQRRKRGS